MNHQTIKTSKSKKVLFLILRSIFWFLTHTIYRIKVIGKNNFPKSGPALLVCNHLSYIDPFLIGASAPRHIRFFVWRKFYDLKVLNWLFKLMRSIPISSIDKPKQFLKSIENARLALKQGDIVCIFAEGGISRIAQTLSFRRGVEFIAKDLKIPIIPMHLDRVWGSIFSFSKSKFIWKLPTKFPYPITVSFGKQLPSTARTHEIRQSIIDLGSEAFKYRLEDLLPLHQTFYREAKNKWFRNAITDSSELNLNYGKTILASFFLARKFTKLLPDDKNVGILLPSCVPGALTNIALLFAGKVPVNLNFTMPQDLINKTQKIAEINKIITSKKVLEALNWQHDDRMIYLEDLGKPSHITGVFLFFFLWIIPANLIELIFLSKSRTRKYDLATILFTSGSTGVPKGVMLTHDNIQANVQSLIEIFNLQKTDTFIGVLPFFHSFGYTATIWLPLLSGCSVAYHKSPLEPVVIQNLIKKHKGTIIMSTPTFLQMWTKKFQKEEISSLRFVIVGAEKLRDDIAHEFIEKFNIPVLEGYGCTELSPVACVNILDIKDENVIQIGNKIGKVGRPIPGVSAKIINPETNELLSLNEPGLLLIKGPNVMKGYWKNVEKTKEVINDGWYITGDIASIDEDGFVQITDRLSRFSKIGGEMVPHILIENYLYQSANDINAKFLVMSIPNKQKGESLVVLYHNFNEEIDCLLDKLNNADLPKIWIPHKLNFFKIADWPILGTGKVDFGKAKEIVKNLINKD